MSATIIFKILLSCIIILGAIVLESIIMTGVHPVISADIAIDQVQNSDLSAVTQRTFDQAKNWFSWLYCLPIVLLLWTGEIKKCISPRKQLT